MAALPLLHYSTMILGFYGVPGFLHMHSLLPISSLCPLTLSPLQLTAVLSLGLFSKLHFPAPRFCMHQWTHLSGWDMQSHLCRSHSVQFSIDRMWCSPPTTPKAPFLSQLISQLVRGTSLLLQLPLPQGCRAWIASSALIYPVFFLSSYPVRGGLSCPFRYLISSACAPYEFFHLYMYSWCLWGRHELHILLLLRHLDSLHLDLLIKSCQF